MEKEVFNEYTPQSSDNGFVALDSPRFNLFDEWGILGLPGHEAMAERDTGSGIKDPREEIKATYGRANNPSVSHFNIQTHPESIKNTNDKLKVGADSIKREQKLKLEEQKCAKHSCTICHKTYKKKDNLVSHMRKHVFSLY